MARERHTEEEKPDSVKHHEDRRAKMQEESAQLAQHEKERLENQEIVQYGGPVREGETREQLLDRIRKMREAPSQEPPSAGYLTDSLKQQLEKEQEAGRAAVAKAEEEMVKFREARQKAAAEGEKNVGQDG